jgi:glutathione S-transferase
MAVLHHYSFCPHSRFIRLSLSEMGIASESAEERPWDRDPAYLELNPSGTTPVLCEAELAVPGANVIAEYLDETHGAALNGRRLLPQDASARVEVRRLVDWFNAKFFEEVTSYLLEEKFLKRFRRGASPDAAAIRVARANLRYHLRYIGYLAGTRNWLAGDTLTYADLAAAAHLSCVDYLGDVPWDEDEGARDWYARVKSRPAFRPILADRIPGVPPAEHYADLDF